MKNNIPKLSVILFLFGGVALTRASSVSEQTATNWGKSVQGVQLSIMTARHYRQGFHAINRCKTQEMTMLPSGELNGFAVN